MCLKLRQGGRHLEGSLEVLDSPCGAVGVARRAVAQRPWQASGPGWGQTDFISGHLGPKWPDLKSVWPWQASGPGWGQTDFILGHLGPKWPEIKSVWSDPGLEACQMPWQASGPGRGQTDFILGHLGPKWPEIKSVWPPPDLGACQGFWAHYGGRPRPFWAALGARVCVHACTPRGGPSTPVSPWRVSQTHACARTGCGVPPPFGLRIARGLHIAAGLCSFTDCRITDYSRGR